MFYIAQISKTAASAQAGSQSAVVDAVLWIFSKLPIFFGALAVVFVTFIVAKIAKAAVIRSLAKNNADDQVVLLVGKVAYLASLVLGFTIALAMVGIDISPIVGLLGLGIGFALQDIIKNFVCGALILIQEPFRIGDIIQVGALVGKVEGIEARSTNVKTFDGQRVIVPNADMFMGVVTNFSLHPEKRVEIIVGVHYATDLAFASNLLLEIVESHEDVIPKPKPQVWATEFSDSAINLSVKFWIERELNGVTIKSDLIKKIKVAFENANINIPYPIRTLDLPSNVTNLSDMLADGKGTQSIQSPVSEESPANDSKYVKMEEKLNMFISEFNSLKTKLSEHMEVNRQVLTNQQNSVDVNPAFKHVGWPENNVNENKSNQ